MESESDFSDDPFDFIEVLQQGSETESDELPTANDSGHAEIGLPQIHTPEVPSEDEGTVENAMAQGAELVVEPFHPPADYNFPPRKFGNQNRFFRPSWCVLFPWLHYYPATDSVICFKCSKAERAGKLNNIKNRETQFLKDGFTNWKKAVLKFKDHEGSKCHRRTVQMETEKVTDVGEGLSSAHAKEKEKNREMFHLILSSVQFLARQGIPLRGHGSGEDGNFNQLLKLRCNDNEALKNWLAKKNDTYSSPDIQNEILQIMSLSIVRDIAKNVRENWYTIMADECTDVDNKEQLVICIRWVDDNFEIHEDLLGLHFLESVKSDEIVKVLMDILLRMNVSLKNCRGQCYDGASNMSGRKSGVAMQIENIESRALYMHCYGHSLNLACQDAIKQNKLMRDTLDNTREITKLIKKSPKRDVIFEKIKAEMTPEGSPGIRVLCPTRWTVKQQALESILKNYNTLQQCWRDAKDAANDTETKARLGGVDSSMKTFDYFFGCNIGVQLLGYADNLAKALQSTKQSAMDGQELARMTVTTLKSLRNDEAFESLWKQIKSRRENVDVAEPTLPRKRRVPDRYEEGNAPSEYINSILVHYRVKYYEVLDFLVSGIETRFQQKGYVVYSFLEKLLSQAVEKEMVPYADKELEKTMTSVATFYGDDIDADRLRQQLSILSQHCPSEIRQAKPRSIVEFIKDLGAHKLSLLTEVTKVVKLLLVMPASNAQSERAFSAMRRVKTYLRSTMTQKRLNHCMILHCHAEKTDRLDLINIANEFVVKNQHRQYVFGKFIK